MDFDDYERAPRERRDAVLFVCVIVTLLLAVGLATYRLTRPLPPADPSAYGTPLDHTGDWVSVVCSSLGILLAVLARWRMKKSLALR
jgi:hypothetical protein